MKESFKSFHAHIKPGAHHWLGAGSGYRGLGFNYVIVQDYGVAELYMDHGEAPENKQIFDGIFAHKDEIESKFGGAHAWKQLDDKRASRIKCIIESGR